MSNTNGAAIPAHRTLCKDCMKTAAGMDAGLVLKTPAVPIVGEDPKIRLGQCIDALQKHLVKKHPQAFKDLQNQAQQFMMFLGFSYFQTDEPLILAFWNAMRHGLRKRTERYTFEDEALKANVGKIEGLTEEQAGKVLFLLSDLRDVLLEQGRYALLANQPEPDAAGMASPGIDV